MKCKDIPVDCRRYCNEYLRYGTAGFRDKAEKLTHVAYRIGILASLRAKQTNAIVGVMITASHNPIGDNGVKIVDPTGAMLAEEWESAAERIVNCPDKALESNVAILVKEFSVNPDARAVVCGARDTRPSSVTLAEVLKEGVQTVGGEFFDYDLLSTPQLHYVVREANLFGHLWSEEEYFGRVILAFERLNFEDRHFDPLYDPRLFVDCANGVAGRKMNHIASEVKICLDLNVVNYSADKYLNDMCGADFVKSNKRPPVVYESSQVTPNRRWVSFDGDADRLVYYYLDDDDQFHLLDGDKIAALAANYFKSLLEKSELQLKIGVVQTAYANGNATRYLKDELRVPVICTPTGVKHLHSAASKQLDIGIYFEPNGHGTVLFSDKASQEIWKIIECRTQEKVQRFKAAVTLHLLSKLINQAVGDAMTDMLLVETMLRNKRWQIVRWDQLYSDVPNTLIKFKVADRTMLKTADCDRLVTSPAGLAERINIALKKYKSSRAVVRASGTEDVVRIYVEADTQSNSDHLASELQRIVVDALNAKQKGHLTQSPMKVEQ